MRKALASVVVIAFAGLLCVSLLAVFNGATIGNQYISSQAHEYPYFMAY